MTTSRLVVLLTCLLAGCAGARRQAYGALEMLTVAVDPAYSMAMDGCIAREDLVVAEVRAGLTTKDQAREQLVPIRARCDVAREVFERVRLSQRAAKRALDAGDARTALRELDAARSSWKALARDDPLSREVSP